MNKRLLKAIAALAILASIAGCSKDTTQTPKKTERLIFAYLAGDSDLSYEISTKIDALCAGMEKVDDRTCRLIAFADTRNEDAKLMELTSDGAVTLKTYGDINSADPEKLSEIISYTVSSYPAESYGLICFSHASGWLPEGALANPYEYGITEKSVFKDGDREMSTDDFAKAITLKNGIKYDFIIMETCYMAGIETAYPLRKAAKFLMASSAEMVSPGLAKCYPENLHLLYKENADLKGFASAYFDYWNSQSGAAKSATVSIIDLSMIGDLATETAYIIKNGNYLISNPEGIQHFNRNHYRLFFDLADYLEAVAGKDKELLTKFNEKLDRTIIYAAATESFMRGYPYSFNIRSHCGITSYIPQPGLERLNADYEKTEYCKEILNDKN